MMKSYTKKDWLNYCFIAIAIFAIYYYSPRAGQFWWSESPRNALNGAFILDLIRTLPFDDPVGWAEDYYLKYPALTILFYPPLLHVVIAIFFAIFGVSHTVAVACISSFLFLLALGVYDLVRRFSNPWVASASTLLLLSAPEIVIWGQQVMLEIPMLALITWGAIFLLRYGDDGRIVNLTISTLFMILAVYTKQTAAFIIIGLIVSLISWQGLKIFKRQHIWVIALISLISLVPLVLMQLKFGSFNLTSAIDRPDVEVPNRFTWAGIFWYIERFPKMIGLPSALLSVVGLFSLILYIIRKRKFANHGDILVSIFWFLSCYIFLSLISLKETRHGLVLVVPIIFWAGFALNTVVRNRRIQYLLPVVAGFLLVWTLWEAPTPVVTGYREVAEEVGDIAPINGRVLFVGNRDGAFIFNVRALPNRNDIQVVRADKIFLNINVMPALGLNPRNFDQVQISDMLNEFGISLVVTVPRQWSEAPVMALLADLLVSKKFEEVRRFPVTGKQIGEKELVLYRNLGTLADPPKDFRFLVRVGGRTLNKN